MRGDPAAVNKRENEESKKTGKIIMDRILIGQERHNSETSTKEKLQPMSPRRKMCVFGGGGPSSETQRVGGQKKEIR